MLLKLVDAPEIPLSLKGNIAVLPITTYEDWLLKVGKKTRNMVRKAERSLVLVTIKPEDSIALWDSLVMGVFRIYNETPVRQNRAFHHYGVSYEAVKAQVMNSNGLFICAYYNLEIVGFVELLQTGKTAVISQILSLVSCRDKAVNNALISKVVQHCVCFGLACVVYGRFGNHPSLDQFKRNNGFELYHIAGVNGLRDYVPERVKVWLLPVYAWCSRVRVFWNKAFKQ